MKRIFKISIAISAVVFSSIAGAETITVVTNASTGKFVLPDGSTFLGTSDVFAYGVLDTAGYAEIPELTVDNVLTVFDVYGSFNFDASGNILQIGQPLTGGTFGEKLYAFVYTGDNNSLGIFSSNNSLWNYPNDSIGGSTLSSAFINEVTAGDIIAGSPNTFQLTAAVPEPETYAAIFGALVLGLAVWRRRR